MNRITFPLFSFSVSFAQLKMVFDAATAELSGVVKSGSLGKNSAGFCNVSGWGVPLCRFHIVPVTDEKHFLSELLAPEFSCIRYAVVFSRFLTFRFERRIVGSIFSPKIYPLVWICMALSSGLVCIEMHLPSHQGVPYVGLPIVSGVSSSLSSSSSSSESVSLFSRNCTIFSGSFRLSRSISSHRPYFSFSHRRQHQFFGCIPPPASDTCSRLTFFSR